MNVFFTIHLDFLLSQSELCIILYFFSLLNEAKDCFPSHVLACFFAPPHPTAVVFVAVCSFYRCCEQGLLSSCGVQVSHCSGSPVVEHRP